MAERGPAHGSSAVPARRACGCRPTPASASPCTPSTPPTPRRSTQRADVAMYLAKRSGSGHAVYKAELDRSSVRRLACSASSARALDERQLELHFQPLVDLRSGAVVRAEALVRWKHPEQGLLAPDEFIELAEVSGVIQPLTRWVLAEAVERPPVWRRAGHRVGVAVNLSVRNLYDPDLAADVDRRAGRRPARPSDLMLELTESELMDDPRLAARGVHRARRARRRHRGRRLRHRLLVARLPPRTCPSARSRSTARSSPACTDAHDDLTIVRSMIDLGHNLGLEVVAEGRRAPRRPRCCSVTLGCDLAQGFLIVAAADLRRPARVARRPPRPDDGAGRRAARRRSPRCEPRGRRSVAFGP